MLYRELVRRGISDYLIAPVGTIDVVRSVCGLFSAPDAKPVGRVIAVVGAKGGVGASTVAHNIAWAIARDLAARHRRRPTSISASAPPASTTIRIRRRASPTRCSRPTASTPNFIDRLLSKCTDHLSLLAAPATLDRVYDFSTEAFDSIFDSLRATMPCIVLDVPHQWTRLDQARADRRRRHPGRRRRPTSPICAMPRTCSICSRRRGRTTAGRTTASTRSACRSGRRSSPADFAKALDDEPIAVIPFEPQMFGTAANNGQMIAELSSSHRVAEIVPPARAGADRPRRKRRKSRSGLLSPFLDKLLKRSGAESRVWS